MGLKWFRARMSLDKSKIQSPTGVSGFYRTISNFDNDVWPPQPTNVRKPRAPIPVLPPQIPNLQSPQNSMATLAPENISLEFKRDSGLSEGEHEGQFKLPRASVDILREKHNDEFKKSGIKKKKGVAPRPNESLGIERDSSARELVI